MLALVKRLHHYLLIGLCIATTQLHATPSADKQPPVCPGGDTAAFPVYSTDSHEPTIATWSNLKVLPDNCYIVLEHTADMTVAFASIFTGPQSLDEITSLIGAISTMQGLQYWSVTDKRWKEFITQAYAVESLNNRTRRQDFSAQEIESKSPLYFAQNDSRSWGLNIYSIEAINASDDGVTITTRNETAVKLGPVTVFKAGAAQSVVFISRRDENTWEYYSLSVVKDSVLPVNAKSLINRQASLYRLLTEQDIVKDAPLGLVK